VFVVVLMPRQKAALRALIPEKLMLADDVDMKFADFGLAKRCLSAISLTTQCSSRCHVAPEVLEGVPYYTWADIWNVGDIMYTMVGG